MTITDQDRAIEAEVEAAEARAVKMIIQAPSSQRQRWIITTMALVVFKIIAERHGFDPRTGEYTNTGHPVVVQS